MLIHKVKNIQNGKSSEGSEHWSLPTGYGIILAEGSERKGGVCGGIVSDPLYPPLKTDKDNY